MMVDFPCEIGIVLLRALEHHLASIGKLVGGQVDLAKAAFADKATELVVADDLKVGRGEFAKE